jgi:hypothetical protein
MVSCLYRARSRIRDFEGLALAEVFWVPLRAERLRSGPLSCLVKDAESLSATELSLVKGFLDELLTPPEAVSLKRALQKEYDLELEEKPLPLDCRDLSGTIVTPLRVLPAGCWAGRKTIPHRGNLELPFDVLALWRDAKLSLSKEENEDGHK